MKKFLLSLLLLLVPLAVAPSSVTFDAVKAFLLAGGALALAALALPGSGDGRGNRFDLSWSPATAVLAAGAAVYAASGLLGADPWAAARAAALVFAAVAVFAAVENAVFHPVDLGPLLGTATAALGVGAGYGLLQAAGLDVPWPWRHGPPVPVSTHGNPNFAAEWTAAALPLGVLCALRARGGARFAAGLACLLGAAFLAVARGRAALLLGLPAAAAAGGALWLEAEGGARRQAGRLLGGALVLGLAGSLAFVLLSGGEIPAAFGRSDTVVIRTELARGTARMIADHPLGVGAGNWEAAHPPYRTEREYVASLFRDPGEAHDEPLQFTAEGGWAVGLAGLALLVLLARAALRGARGEGRAEAAALGASLAATAAVSLASAPLHRPAHLLLAAVAGGGLASLGGGRLSSLGAGGLWARRGVVALLLGGTLLLGQKMMAEGPQSEARRILRESDPLPAARARKARDLLDYAAILDPGAVDALVRSGEISLKLHADLPSGGRFAEILAPGSTERNRDRALEKFEAAAALRPLDPMILSNLAAAQSTTQLGGASSWERALESVPFHRNANHGLGFHVLRLGLPAAALARFEAALRVDPRYAPSVAARAECLVLLGREAEATDLLSSDLDGLLGNPPRDLAGAALAARRAAEANPLLAMMLLGKGVRLAGGPDPGGGAAVLLGVGAGRPEEEILDRAARALAAAGREPDALLFRAGARLAAGEAALAAEDREKAAAEAGRALQVRLSTAASLPVRARAASLLSRAGKREAALAELGAAVDRGFTDLAFLEERGKFKNNRHFPDLSFDPAFQEILRRARERAAREAPPSAEK